MSLTLNKGAEQLVLSLMDAGAGLDDVERRIERIGRLDEEDRAALWLLAWSHQDRRAGVDEPRIESVSE